jgi:Methyltransferase domain
MSTWLPPAKRLDRFIFSELQEQFTRELGRALEDCDSLLDVGCGATSPIERLPNRVPHSVGVDLFAPAIERSMARGVHDRYVVGDALKLNEVFSPRSFDCVLAADLIEHLGKEDGFRLMEQMELIARKTVVIFTPNGFIAQHVTDGNPLQVHRSGWTAPEMRVLGYAVTGINGWRPLRGEGAQARWWPRAVWSRVSYLSQWLTTSRPNLAFALLCVKRVGVEKSHSTE